MKAYTGASSGSQRSVAVDGQPLRLVWPGHRRGAPFEWGEESLGAEHLAEAILLDNAGEDAMRVFGHEFMMQVVSKLPTPWSFSSDEIQKWLKLRTIVGLSVQKACYALSGSEDSPPPAEPLRPSDIPKFPVDPVKHDR
jgi:hypothetical protein